MALTDLKLLAAARRSYEAGRLLRGARTFFFVLPVTGLAALSCHHPTSSCGTGAVLCVLSAALLWRGGAAGRAVWPGLLSGLLPFLVPLLLARLTGVCSPESCALGGLAAGISLGLAFARRSDVSLLSAAAVAGLTGSLGCILPGVAGVAGMSLGLALGAGPALVFRRATA